MAIYEDIMAGLQEAIAYEQGKGPAKKVRCTVNPVPEIAPDEIKELRNALNMTQSTFAAVLGVSCKTVEAWETGTNSPLGTARRMLNMLQADKSIPIKYHIISE